MKLLQSLQDAALPTRLINPFYFPEPVAPLVAARARRRTIRLPEVVAAIRRVAGHCDVLLVEGAGGLLAPLSQRFDLRHLIAALHCATIVVSRNRLGTINHTRLTLEALRGCELAGIQIALMEQKTPDASAKTNAAILGDLLRDIPVIPVPYLGPNATRAGAVKASAKKIKKTLAHFASFASFRPVLWNARRWGVLRQFD